MYQVYLTCDQYLRLPGLLERSLSLRLSLYIFSFGSPHAASELTHTAKTNVGRALDHDRFGRVHDTRPRETTDDPEKSLSSRPPHSQSHPTPRLAFSFRALL